MGMLPNGVLVSSEKYEFVNGKDCPIYEMENKIHVWNHQPDIVINHY
jgi:hypothetical protein